MASGDLLKNEIYWEQHCEEEHCSMGSANYECPWCEAYVTDYGDLFYDEFDLKERYECPECSKPIRIVSHHEWDHIRVVEKIET